MASLDVPRMRRKAVTYGKANKRPPLHDIFDHTPEARTQTTASSSSVRKLLEPTVQLAESAEDSSELSAASSPKSYSLKESHSLSPSLFEIETSDEESRPRNNDGSAPKRRRLTPTEKTTTSVQNVEASRAQRQRRPLQRKPKQETQASVETREEHGSQTAQYGRYTKSQLKTFSRTKPVSRQSRLGKMLNSPGDTSTADEESLSSRPASPASANSPASLLQSAEMSALAGDPEVSEKFVNDAPETPKKRKMLRAEAVSGVIAPSPSQLGLKNLRLTPDRGFAAKEDTTEAAIVYATQLTPRRGRPRLVDRLDSPRTASDSGIQIRSRQKETARLEQAIEVERECVTHPGQESPVHDKASISDRPRDTRRELETVRSGQAYNLTRTYAQERSHLSDMVNKEQDVQMVTAPEDPTTQPASQDSTYSSIKSQLELEESDSDDQTQGGNVRSIHELRQAGANNRFERELETLLDDIDPKTSHSKGLRLQALMQLISKLNEESFARQFVDVGIASRLTTMVDSKIDVLSAALIAFAFASIGHVERANPALLRQMLEIIHSLPAMIFQEKRGFVRVAKDRKQNVSKSLARELGDFESTMLSNSMWDDHRPVSLTPQIILLHTIAIITLSLRKLGETKIAMPILNFHELLSILSDGSQQLVEAQKDDDCVLIVELSISILERSQPPPEMLGDDDNPDYHLVGQSLTRILEYSAKKDETLEQAALRVVVNLSNNKSALSKGLASSTVISAALGVVKDNFMNLAKSADAGEDLDRPKLDCVMLALGCLLNFVDSSAEARVKMIESHGEISSPMDWLVAVFNDRVGRAADATTIDQSQVLVAFGYLAMLLCSLCTDDTVRPYAVQRLNGHSLNELCLAGEVFFNHLKEIDINPNDGAMSAFTEHFGNILATVENYATN